jgi:hypothetical protein
MRNGNEYRQSIHQQIRDLLEKAHLGDNDRAILNKLDFGMMKVPFCLSRFYICLNRNFITGFT